MCFWFVVGFFEFIDYLICWVCCGGVIESVKIELNVFNRFAK